MDEELKQAIMSILDLGYQLEQEAFVFLQTNAKAVDVEELARKVVERLTGLSEKPTFITRAMLKEAMEGTPTPRRAEPPPDEGVGKVAFHPYAKDVSSDIEVVEDPTDKLNSGERAENFLNYFRDRFGRLERVLRQRLDVKDATSIGNALEAPVNSEVKTIGIVTEKREHKHNIFLQVEDQGSSATVLVPSTASKDLFEKAQRVLLDQVVCVQAKRGRSDLLVATDLIYPDIPDRKTARASEPVYAALISDLHIGSKVFFEEGFNRFLSWLRGGVGNGKQMEIAGRVKYVVIAGDIVDGIGVYPGQEKELAISDIFEQYRLAAQFIEQIPEYIEIVIIPGNHDATRQALPQPAISKKYAEPIYEGREVIMLGDPARIRLHGVELLLYHGRSLDDVIGAVPDIMYRNLNMTVARAMEQLLKARHLAPVYGQKTPIAPEGRDLLVIERPPDIFHAGHVHVTGHETYRGTLVLNSGAWQGQTDYQRKMGLEPTYGVASIVDLQTFQVMSFDFKGVS